VAIWQFSVEFVPAGWLGNRQAITEDDYNESLWWVGNQPSQGFEQKIAALLPEAKSWSPHLRQWGVQESDLVEVWYENGVVDSVSARLDCRNINPLLLRKIFELSEAFGCRMVYMRDLTVVGEDFESFVQKLWDSPNHKFLENPGEWLPKMAKEVADRENNR